MPSRRLLGSFENVKRKVCSHPYFGGETIKDPGQKARVHNGNEFPRSLCYLWGGNMKQKRLSSLDSLRGLAAIGVAIFYHYVHFKPQFGFPFSQKAYWLYQYGWTLVDFFFVLSGFVFSYVYKKQIADRLISLRDYCVNRLSRLYPLHILTLLVVAIIQFARYVWEKEYFIYPYNDVYHFLLNLFFLQSGWFDMGWSFNAPSWSVAVEVMAYLLFFVVLYKLPNNKNYILIYIAFVLLGLTIKDIGLNVPILNDKVARVLIGFFIGCLTYEIHIYINSLQRSTKRIITFILLCVLCYVVFLAITFGHGILGQWHMVYIILIYPLVLFLTLNIKLLNNALSIKPLSYLGYISYSIYLWHFSVQLTIRTIDELLQLNLNYSSKIVFFGYAFVTITISIVSHELFEKPFMNSIRRRMKRTS